MDSMTALALPLALLAATAVLASCGKTEPNAAKAADSRRERALAQRLKAACSSPATYDRLKQVAFDDAIRIRNADPVNLDTLATYSVARVENPVVKSRDETLDVTVCSGRFVLQVPPGAEVAFGGKRQLAADIEYAAQAAADGSGLVYQVKGAEPIIYRLATFDLRRQSYRPARPAGEAVEVAAAEPRRETPSPLPPEPPVAAPSPRAVPASSLPAPAPRVTVRAAAAQPAPAAPRVVERPPAAPSFDCRRARSRSERMVCGDAQLAGLDRAMSSRFYAALSRGDERTRTALRRSRDRFLAYRERCPDPACVAAAYRDRMDEIADISSGR